MLSQFQGSVWLSSNMLSCRLNRGSLTFTLQLGGIRALSGFIDPPSWWWLSAWDTNHSSRGRCPELEAQRQRADLGSYLVSVALKVQQRVGRDQNHAWHISFCCPDPRPDYGWPYWHLDFSLGAVVRSQEVKWLDLYLIYTLEIWLWMKKNGTGRDCENGLDLLYRESSRRHRIFSSLSRLGGHTEDKDIRGCGQGQGDLWMLSFELDSQV